MVMIALTVIMVVSGYMKHMFHLNNYLILSHLVIIYVFHMLSGRECSVNQRMSVRRRLSCQAEYAMSGEAYD